jgi:hypothetical protein
MHYYCDRQVLAADVVAPRSQVQAVLTLLALLVLKVQILTLHTAGAYKLTVLSY